MLVVIRRHLSPQSQTDSTPVGSYMLRNNRFQVVKHSDVKKHAHCVSSMYFRIKKYVTFAKSPCGIQSHSLNTGISRKKTQFRAFSNSSRAFSNSGNS